MRVVRQSGSILTNTKGKSTFTRVIKSTLGIISQRELALFSDVLRANTLQAMQALLRCYEIEEDARVEDPEVKMVEG